MFFNDKKKFSEEVKELVKTGDYSYIEAVLHLCEEYEIDPSACKRFLTPPLKEKIQKEGMESNMFPKGGKLSL